MLSLALFALLTGCPDPTTAADLGNPGPGGANPGQGPAGTPPEGGGMLPPSSGSFDVAPGQGVLISGVLVYSGDQTGTIRLDFLRKEGDAPPQLAHMIELDSPGPFSVEAPKGIGALYLVAFVDVDSAGPSSSDPAGRTASVAVDEAPIEGLEIVLLDEPDLGDFTPGNEAPPTANGGEPAVPEKTPEQPKDEAAAPQEVPVSDTAEATPAAPEGGENAPEAAEAE